MQLDKYLEILENCPDGNFEKEFHICDNWPVLLLANYNEVVKDLVESVNSDEKILGSYSQIRNISGDDGAINKIFEYIPGIVNI